MVLTEQMENLHEAAGVAADHRQDNPTEEDSNCEVGNQGDELTAALEDGQRLLGEATSRLESADLWPVLDHSVEEILYKVESEAEDGFAPLNLETDDSMDEKSKFLDFFIINLICKTEL